MNISRRAFLRYASTLSVAGAATPFAINLASLSAATADTNPSDYKALVCIFLQGGNDQANSVIATDPDSYAIYQKLRSGGSIAVPIDSTRAIDTASTHSGRSFALHPSLNSIAELYGKGEAAIVANVGPLVEPLTRNSFLNQQGQVPPKLFSHNDQTSVWQAFAPEGAQHGWGGRMGDLLAAMNGEQSFTCISPAGNAVWISGTETVPYQVAVSGPTAINGVNGGLSWSPEVSSIFRQIVTASSSNVFEQSVAALTQSAIDAQQKLQSAIVDDSLLPPVPSLPATGSANWLATQLRIVARIIGGRQQLGMRRQVFLVTLGGFDTHDNQLERHAPLLEELSQATSYFRELMDHETIDAGKAVTLMTASEFGRTLVTNGDGTDHGWGSHHFVVGAAVNGGDVVGRFPDYALDGADDVGNGRLLPGLSVDQYGATLARWFGVDETMLDEVFPNLRNFGSARDLGFMG